MTKQETINQLKSLKKHCESMTDYEDSSDIWNCDVEALEKAIKIIEVTPLE